MDRDDLEKKLAASGYQHPDAPVTNFSPYQSYSGDEKNPYQSQNYDPYAVVDSEEKPEKPKTNVCPTCQSPAMYVCNCEVGEVMCLQGHSWYFLASGQLVVGDPHEETEN